MYISKTINNKNLGPLAVLFKVNIFWEGHTILQNLHCRFDLTVITWEKSTVEISQKFVAFSEQMNFNKVMIILLLQALIKSIDSDPTLCNGKCQYIKRIFGDYPRTTLVLFEFTFTFYLNALPHNKSFFYMITW